LEISNTLPLQLQGDTVLVFPPSPGAPPKLNTPSKSLDDLRSRAMQLVALASLAGLPQVTIPVGTENGKEDGIPLAFSIVGGHGCDGLLLEAAVDLSRGVRKVAEMYWKRGKEGGGRGMEQRAEEAKNRVGAVSVVLCCVHLTLSLLLMKPCLLGHFFARALRVVVH
jgi:hypothetical protein